jgi:hypothetical protein
VPDAEQTRKALEKLVHDLRTPLGVAIGYMRLLRDHRLSAPEDQQRAMVQTVDALGAMSGLCQDAASFAATAAAGDETIVSISAAELAAEVGGQLPPPLAFAHIDNDLAGVVRVRKGGATARAVAALLSRGLGSDATPSTDIIVGVQDAHLSFVSGTPAQREAIRLGERRAFDPWRAGPGLAVPLACLEVARVSGQVLSEPAATTAIAVMLPLETSPS